MEPSVRVGRKPMLVVRSAIDDASGVKVARLAWHSLVLLSVASAVFSIVALAALGASASAALAACNDQTDHAWGVAGVPCSRSAMVAGSDRSIIVDFLAGGPMLSIAVLADWDVTSVTADAAAAAACKGGVGVR